jgi:SAM-dependent methyltransferase
LLTDAGEIDDERGFASMAEIYEGAYLPADNARAQSGFGGDEARGKAGRRAIVETIDRDGSFLDVGCASGQLLESVVAWSPHRIEPFGLELAPGLAELARRRLPRWADRIVVGNALTWEPPRRFDFVRTELVYVPVSRRADYVRRRLAAVVAPRGRLIVCGYGSPRSGLRRIRSARSCASSASCPSSSSPPWRRRRADRGARRATRRLAARRAGVPPARTTAALPPSRSRVRARCLSSPG